jgi:hypothetical protein
MSQQEIQDLFGGSVTSAADKKPAASTATADLAQTFPKGSEAVGGSMYTAIQFPSGFNAAAMKLIGAPVDLVNWGFRKVGLPVSEKPFMGEDFLREQAAKIGIEPDKYPARSLTEKVVRAGGEAAGYAVLPQAGLEATASRALGAIPKAPAGITGRETAEKVFGASRPGSLAATGANIATNVGGGAGAELAMEMVPERFKTLAGMAGGVTGAGLTQLGVEGAKTLPKMGRAAFEYLQPIWNPEKVAAREFAEGVGSRNRVLDILENEQQELIPGSKPTTFEMTGDTNIGQMQLGAETRSPTLFHKRTGEQAIARQAALEGVAPEGSPLEVSKILREGFAAIEARENAAIQRAEQRARNAVEQMDVEGTADDYGRLLRQFTQEAKDAAKKERRALYSEIDPKGTLNIVSRDVRGAAERIATEAGADLARPLEGEVAAIVTAAQGIGDVIPFASMRALDTRIGDAMRAELRANGETNTYRQLVQMKNSVSNAIDDAVENQAKYEADTALAGKTAAEGTLEPNLTQQSVESLSAAKKFNKDYMGTFREGSVGEVLKSAGGKGQYKLAFDAKVGPQFFRAGDTGFEAAQQFLKAVGDNPQAVETMKDYIVSSAFNKARDPKTGLINQTAFDAWKKKHGSALRAFPDVADRLSTVSKASEAATEVATRSRTTIENAQKSELANIMGAADNQTVSKVVGEIFGQPNAQRTMRNLADAAASNPDAAAGLQRAVADYIRQRFISTAEVKTSEAKAINSAAFQKFVRDNRKTLEQVFDREQVNTLQALADDLNRGARSVTGNLTGGRSATEQIRNQNIEEGKSYWDGLVRGVGAVAAPVFGGSATSYAAGPVAGLAVFGGLVGANIANSMRAAGMQTVDQLITDALLNPEQARKLLRAAPRKDTPEAARGASDIIANTIITGTKQPIQTMGPLTIYGPGDRTGRASGGAVNLMALSKAAKKQVTQVTEPLLNESDDTVAHALEIANKQI